jgi:signal transduction histidine kinase
MNVEGTPRDLVPLVRDEAYRITGEVLRNAFQHAHAKRIEVEIRYDSRQLRVRARDDGKGIDPKVLDEGGRTHRTHRGTCCTFRRGIRIRQCRNRSTFCSQPVCKERPLHQPDCEFQRSRSGSRGSHRM